MASKVHRGCSKASPRCYPDALLLFVLFSFVFFCSVLHFHFFIFYFFSLLSPVLFASSSALRLLSLALSFSFLFPFFVLLVRSFEDEKLNSFPSLPFSSLPFPSLPLPSLSFPLSFAAAAAEAGTAFEEGAVSRHARLCHGGELPRDVMGTNYL